jgi:aminoglycoside 6'-N-acetyltransferase I
MRVGRAEPGDAPVVGALIARFFVEEGFAGESAVVGARAAGFLDDAHNAAFLAWEGSEPVGVATVTTTFGFEMGRYAELEDLYVVPGQRRRGVARALVEAAVAWAGSVGCSVVEIVVTPDGEERHGLSGWYRSIGFAETGRRILHRFTAESE